MTLKELEKAVRAAGGGPTALAYAQALLDKLNRLEASGRFKALLAQLRSSREPGDFRGRVLEVNFSDAFLRRGITLIYGARQGGTGDIDFLWKVADVEVFIEMKLLGQDRATRDAINADLASSGVSEFGIADDTRDVGRIQLDLIQKATTRKFNPKPSLNTVNLVAIDVAELQLGSVDLCDCVLAAGGNSVASLYFPEVFLRERVIGVFERPEHLLSAPQQAWIDRVHRLPQSAPHPRDYIHGALFLFRRPKETAALSYDLTGVIVWNPALITRPTAASIASALNEVIPTSRGDQDDEP